VLVQVQLGLETVLTLLTVELDRSLRLDLVDPCAVLLHPLLAEEVQLALGALVQRAQIGFHHLASCKVHLQLMSFWLNINVSLSLLNWKGKVLVFLLDNSDPGTQVQFIVAAS